jgi:hypothetical protein
MTLAHVGAMPVEELLTLAPAAGAALVALRARAQATTRRCLKGRPRRSRTTASTSRSSSRT